MTQAATPDLVEMATEIASAYVRSNSVHPADVPALLQSVHGALSTLSQPAPVAAAPEKLVPPVPIRKTVTDEFLISLEDGKPYKTLKRHLGKLGLTPEQYRAKWGLPADYPTVSAAYSRMRSASAKETGLGRGRRRG